MDTKELTPDELRRMADEMEADSPDPHAKHVRIGEIELDVDMRVIGDIKTLRLIREVDRGGENLVAAVDLFDRILGDDRERVEEALSVDGFCSAMDYAEFCMKVMQAVAKN